VKAAVIVDTNVVVAAFPTARSDLPFAAILQGMLNAAFPFAVSASLLAEYREVLGRPALQRLHALDGEAIESLVAGIARHAIVVEPATCAPAPDPGDQMLWDLLAARADLVLVTSDKLLLRDRAMRGRVITPQAFLAAA
jgi:predicted nucleic acid-binding protein